METRKFIHLTRFSILFRNTSRKSCCEQAPDSTIFTTRSDFKNTSWYDCTAFWNASSAMIGVSPFKNAINRDVIVSSWCRVILTWRLVISVGCFALNGYDIQRDTNTYNWIRVLRSSSSRSCRFCNSSSFFSLTMDGEGDVGLGKEFTRDDALDGWLTLSCVVLEGDKFLSVLIVFFFVCACACAWIDFCCWFLFLFHVGKGEMDGEWDVEVLFVVCCLWWNECEMRLINFNAFFLLLSNYEKTNFFHMCNELKWVKIL